MLVSRLVRSLLLFVLPACASLIVQPSGAKASDPLPLAALFWAQVQADWNDDGHNDAAVITAPGLNESDAALLIYMADPQGGPAHLDAERRDFLWGTRALFGQEPELALGEAGALEVSTKNSAIGRGRWFQTLVLERHATWKVVGYRYEHYDTLEPAEQGLCYLNLSAATRQRTEGPKLAPLAAIKPERIAALRPVALAKWQDGIGLRACGIIDD